MIDTPNTYLYYVLGNGQAVRYGIGVGRDGFRWSGVQQSPARRNGRTGIRRQKWSPVSPICRASWQAARQSAWRTRAYLGNSIYRIHGTNAPSTIGGRRLVRLHPLV